MDSVHAAVSSATHGGSLDYFLVKPAWHSPALHLASDTLGWICFIAWSLSFYPQILLNYQRKSVIGLNFDFCVINFTKHFSYLLFNASVFFLPAIQLQYHAKFGAGALISVTASDVAFSLHAVACMTVTIFQVLLYERGHQSVSRAAASIGIAAWAFICITMATGVATGQLPWAVDEMNYLQLCLTAIKYVPQAVMNHRRQSTDGWSIGNVLLDLAGAVTAFAQMAVQAADQSSMSVFYGDVGKFGLTMETLAFDLLFMYQHYVMFAGNAPPQPYAKLDTLDAFDLDNDDVNDTPSKFTSRWKAWHSGSGGIRSMHWLSEVPEADHHRHAEGHHGLGGSHTTNRGAKAASAIMPPTAASTTWSSPGAVPGGPWCQTGVDTEGTAVKGWIDSSGGASVPGDESSVPGNPVPGRPHASDPMRETRTGTSGTPTVSQRVVGEVEPIGSEAAGRASALRVDGSVAQPLSPPASLLGGLTSSGTHLAGSSAAVPLLSGPPVSRSPLPTVPPAVVTAGNSQGQREPAAKDLPPAAASNNVPAGSGPDANRAGEGHGAPRSEGAVSGKKDDQGQVLGVSAGGGLEATGIALDTGTHARGPVSEAGSASTESSDNFVVIDLHLEDVDNNAAIK